MTSDRPAPRGGVSARSRRDDLLDDLRATVPVPAVPPAVADRPADSSPATDPAVGPATTPAPTPAPSTDRGTPAPPPDRGTPAVEVRLTPLRWSALRAAPTEDRAGIQFSAGPLQLFLGLRAG